MANEGEDESDYDLNAESDQEQKPSKTESKKQESHKSQLDDYLSKLAYQAPPSRKSNKMKYVEPEESEEEEEQ